MAWFWHGAYVRSSSQHDLANSISDLLERKTEGHLSLNDSVDANYYMAALAQQVVCVSKSEDEWIAIWGMTSRICALIFEELKLSGMLLGGEDEETGDEPYSTNCWFFMLWNKGLIVDWHVSNPGYYFSNWAFDALNVYVIRYLHYRNIDIQSNSISSKKFTNFLISNPEVFKGDPSLLKNLVREGIDLTRIKEWLSLRASDALSDCSEILKIPFVSKDYDPIAIATYHDEKRGLAHLNQLIKEDHDHTNLDLYKWAEMKVQRIDEMLILPFQWSDGPYRSRSLLDKFSNLFYWG